MAGTATRWMRLWGGEHGGTVRPSLRQDLGRNENVPEAPPPPPRVPAQVPAAVSSINTEQEAEATQTLSEILRRRILLTNKSLNEIQTIKLKVLSNVVCHSAA